MKKEYKIATGWQIFVYIALSLFILLILYLGLLPYIEKKFSLTITIIWTVIAIALICLLILGIIDTKNIKSL